MLLLLSNGHHGPSLRHLRGGLRTALGCGSASETGHTSRQHRHVTTPSQSARPGLPAHLGARLREQRAGAAAPERPGRVLHTQCSPPGKPPATQRPPCNPGHAPPPPWRHSSRGAALRCAWGHTCLHRSPQGGTAQWTALRVSPTPRGGAQPASVCKRLHLPGGESAFALGGPSKCHAGGAPREAEMLGPDTLHKAREVGYQQAAAATTAVPPPGPGMLALTHAHGAAHPAIAEHRRRVQCAVDRPASWQAVAQCASG